MALCSLSYSKGVIIVILIVLLVGSSRDDQHFQLNTPSIAKHYSISDYATRSPINVTGDAALDSLGLPGSGNQSQPYLIQGFNFTDYPEDSAIALYDTTRYVTIRDCHFGGSFKVSITLSAAHNVLVFNNSFQAHWRSIYSVGCSNLGVINNTFSYPVALYSSPGCLFTNNILNPVRVYEGHYIKDATNSIIVNNTCVSGGIYVETGTNVTFSNNTVGGKPIGHFEGLQDNIINGADYGQIGINQCRNVTVKGGTFNNNDVAIWVVDSTNCTVQDVNTYNCWSSVGFSRCNQSFVFNATGGFLSSIYGVSISDSQNIIARDCEFTACGYYGVSTWNSERVTIIDNMLQNGGWGIYVYESSQLEVANNQIISNNMGLEVSISQDIQVIGNAILDSQEYGILLNQITTDSVRLSNNNVTGGTIGIEVENSSDGPLIENNTINSGQNYGINLELSTNVTVRLNNFSNCGLGINGLMYTSQFVHGDIQLWKHQINGNTVNTHPLVYLREASDQAVDPSAGQVWLIDCDTISVLSLNVSNSGVGCGIAHSSNIHVSGLISDFNIWGIFLTSTYSCTVEFSRCSFNVEGIYGQVSTNLRIHNNTCKYNDENMVVLGGPGLTVTSNECGHNTGVGVLGSYGSIGTQGCSHADISNNTCYDAWSGIYVSGFNQENVSISGNNCYQTGAGIWTSSLSNSSVVDNFCHDSGEGVGVWLCYNITLLSNVFSEIVDTNVHVYHGSDNTLDSNHFGGCTYATVFFEASPDGAIRNNNLTGDAPIGIQLKDSPRASIYNNTVDIVGSLGSVSVLLNDSSDCILQENLISGAINFGIHSFNSTNTICRNNTIMNCANDGIWFDSSVDGQADSNWISDCLVGIHDSFCNTSIHIANQINYCSKGIFLQESRQSHTEYNILFDNIVGIEIEYSYNIILSHNNISYSQSNGFTLNNVDTCAMTDNLIHNSIDTGLAIYQSQYVTVTNGTFYSNGQSACVLIEFSNNCVLSDCEVRDNSYGGVYLESSTDCLIINNVIMNNLLDGIRIMGSSNQNTVYGNTLALNIGGNGKDYGINNAWDDGMGIGNIWDDYSGTGVYQIPGSAGSIDHYPLLYDINRPSIDSPADIYYDYGATNQIITWSCSDDNPSLFYVFVNGTQINQGVWDGSNIFFNVTGLTPGVYDYTLLIYDLGGNYASDSVLVIVTGPALPSIIGAPIESTTIEVGSSESVLTWNVVTPFPNNYQILVNGTVVQEGDWDGSAITFGLGQLSVGLYNITLVAYDELGNFASDSVWVQVNPSSLDLTQIPISQIVAIAALCILGYFGYRILAHSKKQKSESDWREMLDDFGRY
ncbi:MAG: hypothetical protein AM326_06990 [Candidatus Thorarchaeota archaeon SMTZ-45]|nr:MAG: hypothetical protein AM326_06990 [Candidatus Thorarchaeota archaeon SMTZ-45]